MDGWMDEWERGDRGGERDKMLREGEEGRGKGGRREGEPGVVN